MRIRFKILIVLILIGILYLCFGLKPVEAKQLSTPLYFGINEIRTLSTPNWGYAIGDPYANDTGGNGAKLWNILQYSTSTSNDPKEVDVYCVKAGVGFTNGTHNRASYNFSFDMYKERDAIAAKSDTLNGLVNGDHYNELLALADLLYLAEDGTEDLESFLLKAGINAQNFRTILTVDEVKAVQQAAIWYFTNYGEENDKYDKTDSVDGIWFFYTEDGRNYTSLSDYGKYEGQLGYIRQMQAQMLYNYLINTAKENAGNYADENKNYKTKLTLYTATGEKGEEQPLMEIEREKQFDLSLRKYITKVNGENVSISREPNIDLSNLKSGADTTATYNHKKDPVLVETGNVVTYKIQVYNEGDVDGYVNKIIDQLPTGLRFSKIITSGYTASYDSSNNIVTFTREESNDDKLVAFNGSSLDSTTLEIECIVDETKGNKVLTNVAWIEEEETVDGKIITNEVGDDRDSEPADKPQVNKDNMKDYKGKDTNKDILEDSNYYYEGQEDDDDFEKLILKVTGSYDIELIKTDKEDGSKLNGATFKVTLPDGTEKEVTTSGEGTVRIEGIEITAPGIDTIKVEEITAPNGYNKLFDSFEIDVTKEEKSGAYVVTDVSFNVGQENGLTVENFENVVTVTVPNEKITGSYDIELIKTDKENGSKLNGAVFKVTLPDGTEKEVTTSGEGTVRIEGIEITEPGIDTIKVEEITAPNGYNKLFNSFEIDVTKEEKSGAYVVTDVSSNIGQENGLTVENFENVVTVTVPNEKITGSYDIELIKTDKENGNKLNGAVFKVTLPDGTEKEVTTSGEGTVRIEGIEITAPGIDTIKVEEITAPNGYNKLFDSFEIDVTKEEKSGAYVVTDVSFNVGQGKWINSRKF